MENESVEVYKTESKLMGRCAYVFVCGEWVEVGGGGLLLIFKSQYKKGLGCS